MGKLTFAQGDPGLLSGGMDLEQLVRVAIQLDKSGQHQQAERIYRQVLAFDPAHAPALYSLGMLELRAGRSDLAHALLQRALAIAPLAAEWHNDLGLVCVNLGRLDEAAGCFRRTIELAPAFATAHFNLGAVLYAQERFDDASTCYARALELDPQNSAAAHFVALLSGQTSDVAPARYVEELFDTYASTFDRHLVGDLAYCGHIECVRLALRHLHEDADKLRALDLGCGTGLVGSLICARTGELVGVDLSRRMLEEAAKQGIYQRLVHGDLLEMIGHENGAFDLVFAADVFSYMGALDRVLGETRRVLTASGLFTFSVEALMPEGGSHSVADDAAGFVLRKNGRYAHSEAYVLRELAGAGLQVREHSLIRAREEQQRGVDFWIFVCHVTRSQSPGTPMKGSCTSTVTVVVGT